MPPAAPWGPPAGVPGLEYAPPPDRPPGVVTAMGIISLVVALLSFLSSIVAGAQAVRFGADVMRIAQHDQPFYIYASDPGAPAGAARRQEVTISMGPAGLVGFEAAVSLGMAVFLFAGGIRALAASPKAVGMLRAYAGIKVFLAFAAAVGMGWMTNQMKDLDAAFMHTAPEPRGVFAYVGPMLIWLVVGLAYPAALLLLLRGRRVEAFARSKDRRPSAGPAEDPAAVASKLGFVRSDEEAGDGEAAAAYPAVLPPSFPPPPVPAAFPHPSRVVAMPLPEPADLPPPDDPTPPGVNRA